ncbi:ABC transporter permease [Protaetiibacter larvae]|uniref:ABC transporter permease n=1 Tax=Protaetiibacter larvae TaxID=2592654 RepID=A0A5C1Y723_9MICO|nr:ABC transporter permease [Protaetiibacter larvae]QEO08667.1 ABC transporter permease [Protaetiibacter larvae]
MSAPEPVAPPRPARDWAGVARDILSGNVVLSIAAVVIAFLLGGVLIAVTDEGVQKAAGYFFARPGDTFQAIGQAVGGAYAAMFAGAVFNPRGGFPGGFASIAETLTYATPLIAAGVGVAVSFRAGMFNIGGNGQIIAGATFAAWVAVSWPLPTGIHLLVAVVAGILGGALWGGIVGLLKATTGAHEVIVTIMLNYIAALLLQYLLLGPLRGEGSLQPVSAPIPESASYPVLTGRLHLGVVLALLAVVFMWWLFSRSSLGFKIRAVGLNPAAARTAGIAVGRVYVATMLISGGIVAIAGTHQVLGTGTDLRDGIEGSLGFDAITVALLGRSRPGGVLAAGLLFGALRAGARQMQISTGITVDIVLVVQSLIVLFLAAPPLVRAIFRLPAPRPVVQGGAA